MMRSLLFCEANLPLMRRILRQVNTLNIILGVALLAGILINRDHSLWNWQSALLAMGAFLALNAGMTEVTIRIRRPAIPEAIRFMANGPLMVWLWLETGALAELFWVPMAMIMVSGTAICRAAGIRGGPLVAYLVLVFLTMGLKGAWEGGSRELAFVVVFTAFLLWIGFYILRLLEIMQQEEELILGHQQQLLTKEKSNALNILASGVAHELNNPMNIILNYTRVIERRCRQGTEADEDAQKVILDGIGIIRQQGEKAAGIVRTMQLHTPAGEGQLQPVLLKDFIQRNLDLTLHSASTELQQEMEIRSELQDVGNVPVYPAELGRAFVSLLDNSLFALRSKLGENRPGEWKPSLWLLLSRHLNEITLSIKDNGPGIPEAIQARITDPFYTTKNTGSGSGLGLSLTRSVMEQHGGRLEFRSVPGHVTEFCMIFPADTTMPGPLPAAS